MYDLAIAARDMCIAASGSVKEAIDQIEDTNGPMETLDAPGTPESAAQVSESFGARIMRELLALLPADFRKTHEDPHVLIAAIADARERGMHDLAAKLEQRLVGTPLEQPKITRTEVVADSYEHGFIDGSMQDNFERGTVDGHASVDQQHRSSAYREGFEAGRARRQSNGNAVPVPVTLPALSAGEDEHSAAIERDIRLGRTSQEIRDEIIAEVGMLGDARTPEMQARYDAAVERERVEPDEDPRVVGYQGGPNIPAPFPVGARLRYIGPASQHVLDHGGRSFELRTLGRQDDLNVYACGCGRPIRQFEKEALDCPRRPSSLVTIGYEPSAGSLLTVTAAADLETP